MNALNHFEAQILLWIQENLRGFLDQPMRLLTTLGNGGIFWIALTLLLLGMKKTRRTGLAAALSMILTLIVVNIILKPLVARIRPYDFIDGLSVLVSTTGDFAFPSGHSANGLACAWVLFKMTQKKLGLPMLILALIIAFTRIYVGVHYPTDVIGGVAIGIAMAELAMWICRHVEKAREKRSA